MSLDHLLEEADNHQPEEDSLKRVVELANTFIEKEEALALAEANVAIAKKEFNKVSQELIPEAMINAGINSLKLDSGKEVTYQEKLSTSVQDQDKLAKFLEKRGDDGIVKVTLSLGKTPQNILNRIVSDLADKYGLMPDVDQGVHHATVTSYFSGLLGLKKGSTAEMSLADIDDTMVNAFTYYKTTVK